MTGNGLQKTILVFAAMICCALIHYPLQAQTNTNLVLVEAEQFEEYGGWVLDQQFMDLMGSPFLLAHGMGRPVEDATTTVKFPNSGIYRVWVRTRDWVAPWKAPGAPGRFQLLVDDKPLDVTFGTEGDPWHWQFGGQVEVGNTAKLRLHDLTGFEGRCDAILFAKDTVGWSPPENMAKLADLRRQLLGIPEHDIESEKFDFVVVGGGVAGSTAAVTAARLGLSVALIQDRPVLGGNASSEVRVWPEGDVNQLPYPRIGDVVMELVPDRRADSRNAQSSAVFDDDKKLRVVKSEDNITLFLENRMNEAGAADGSIEWVVCQHIRTAVRTKIRGRFFLDSTGDGSLGHLVGADFEQTDIGHMGASNLWNIKCLCEDEDPLSLELLAACEHATFPRCPWAVDLSDKPFPGRTDGATSPQPDAGNKPISLGNWFWESGFDRDPILDMERVRDQNFRAMYGAWDAIKNVEKRYPAHQLNWVAYIAGKRESRRLLGDVILTAEDLRNGKQFEDGCFPCTWGIDTHFPHQKYKDGHEGDEFISDYTRGEGFTYQGPYWVPYRCLYSRNIDNLFMAGRDISVTHEALGAVRVMKTTGSMGEIVGMAASICKNKNCNPREVYSKYLKDLQTIMRIGAGKYERLQSHDGTFFLSAETALLGGKQVRFEPDKQAVGYWRHTSDQAQWLLNVTEPGLYSIHIEYSCEPAEQGGEFEVLAGEELMAHVFSVATTGGWSNFVQVKLFELNLTKGKHAIIVRNNKAKGPLMKLRALRLHKIK